MKTLIDGTYNNFLLPLLVLAIIGAVGWAISTNAQMKVLETKVESHGRLHTHPEAGKDINAIAKDVEAIKQQMEGMFKEQKQVNKNLEQKIDLKSTIILNEIRNLQRQMDGRDTSR